jgi:hypothetical protein
VSGEGGGDCVSAGAGSARSVPLAARTGSFSVTVDVTPGASPTDGAVALALAPQTSAKRTACAVRFAPDGSIQALDRRRFRPGAVAYEAGARYRVRFEVDLATDRYSAFVSREGEAERAVGTSLALRPAYRTAASLDTLVVTAASGVLEACVGP